MTESRDRADRSDPGPRLDPRYAEFQLARALLTSVEHSDPAVRARASEKVARWQSILTHIVHGTVAYGSRTPVADLPSWVTLEVATGGFATGQPLAGGPLQAYEREWLAQIQAPSQDDARAVLNAFFLTEAGLSELGDRLRAGRFEVAVPEEGALLVVAWLAAHGQAERARELLEAIAPYFSTLRFYPTPAERPRRSGARVHMQDVATTLADLRKIRPHRPLMAQKEALEVWAPLHDRVVALFLETFEGERALQTWPEHWSERALSLLAEFTELRRRHTLCGKPERRRGHSAQLRELLAKCARGPSTLTNSERTRVEQIIACYVAKRGHPESAACREVRAREQAAVRAPMFHSIAHAVAARLAKLPPEGGAEDVTALQAPIRPEESAGTQLPAGTPIPDSVARKVARCLEATVEELLERGLITSGDVMARVLPQMTAGIRAAGIADPVLRTLYSAIYQAFRRRRSLLLLNLEGQVQIEELPWVAAIDEFRRDDLSARELSRQTLEEVTRLALAAFPHALIPNKLLQELRALAEGAQLELQLVDELAADIFMGTFTQKFHASARIAASLLDNTLYAAYYRIDYAAVRSLPSPAHAGRSVWRGKSRSPDRLAQLCAERAGVPIGTWDAATNGMIIEQQQILTTQNLAALFTTLDLRNVLSAELVGMAQRCFEWICSRQQMKIERGHAKLVMLKNTAYAWRQMIFFLSLVPMPEIRPFLRWADEHLAAQSSDFQVRFRPALLGLHEAAAGSCGRIFLGWSKERHWLLA